MTKYEIYIHNCGLHDTDTYYGSTPIRKQAEEIIKRLNERGEHVRKDTILADGTRYTSISFGK